MPRAGVTIGGAAGRGDEPDAHSSLLPMKSAAGAERLSHATIARTRGSICPTYETAAAPREWPAMPTREKSTDDASGLYALDRPARTRARCLSPWSVPVVHDFRGA